MRISRIRLSDKTSRLCFRAQRLLRFLNTRGVVRLPNLQVFHHLSLLPDGRPQDGSLSRPRCLDDRASPHHQRRYARRRSCSAHAIYAAPPDPRPAISRQRGHMRTGTDARRILHGGMATSTFSATGHSRSVSGSALPPLRTDSEKREMVAEKAERGSGSLIIFKAVTGDHRDVIRSAILAAKPATPEFDPIKTLCSSRRVPGYPAAQGSSFFLGALDAKACIPLIASC
jgi:hypothetical protein